MAELPQEIHERCRIDLLDVILAWSRFRSASTSAERLAILTEAEHALGPCAGLYLERATLSRELGRIEDADADLHRADAMPATSAWDHVTRGAHHLRSGEIESARVEFERAVERDPRSFWARLSLGRCELTRGRPDDALLSFAICVGLEPENPIGHLHKAHAHARLGQRDKAIHDVERALELDPNSSQARALLQTIFAGK